MTESEKKHQVSQRLVGERAGSDQGTMPAGCDGIRAEAPTPDPDAPCARCGRPRNRHPMHPACRGWRADPAAKTEPDSDEKPIPERQPEDMVREIRRQPHDAGVRLLTKWMAEAEERGHRAGLSEGLARGATVLRSSLPPPADVLRKMTCPHGVDSAKTCSECLVEMGAAVRPPAVVFDEAAPLPDVQTVMFNGAPMPAAWIFTPPPEPPNCSRCGQPESAHHLDLTLTKVLCWDGQPRPTSAGPIPPGSR